jgi:hypothetical protein
VRTGPDFVPVCCACKALWSNEGAIPEFFGPGRSVKPGTEDRFEANGTENGPFWSGANGSVWVRRDVGERRSWLGR